MLGDETSAAGRPRRRLVALVCAAVSVASCVAATAEAQNDLVLSEVDKAVIIASVVRDVFDPMRGASTTVFIASDSIEPRWLPTIDGVEYCLLPKADLDGMADRPPFYTVEVQPRKRWVDVRVRLYTNCGYPRPEVELQYRFRVAATGWKGRYVTGMGGACGSPPSGATQLTVAPEPARPRLH